MGIHVNFWHTPQRGYLALRLQCNSTMLGKRAHLGNGSQISGLGLHLVLHLTQHILTLKGPVA